MQQKWSFPDQVERWDVFEVRVSGPKEGNPFAEQWIRGVFTGAQESVQADGFYDGDGLYAVRFMPSFTGEYAFSIEASFLAEPLTGRFEATPAMQGNHGPVHVASTYHFAYEDSTPYLSLGTTCYVWALQSDELIAQTLETLKHSAFNKIRFCVFPKHYDYNLNEPRSYPYAGTPMDSSVLTPENFQQYTDKTEGNHWDFTRFNPEHFRHLEKCILALREMGIEADLILFHPYDRWGFSRMTREQDEFYLRYVLARFAAFRNIWWSLANEYDIFPHKELADWERIAEVVCACDPYHHLSSIHNCLTMYDFTRPWITHCSIQRVDVYKCVEQVEEFRVRYGKPVVLDEIAYEGDIQHGWGNLTGEEMVRRFWESAVRGGYPGHGETFLGHEGVLWWSHGGKLHGDSPERFMLLRDVLAQTPGLGLKPYAFSWDCVCGVPESPAHQGEYYLLYFSFMRPGFRDFHLDDEHSYRVRVIDTWKGTIEDRGAFTGAFRVPLPARPYMAIQIIREK